MKCQIKQVCYCLLCMWAVFSFSSCEKDLYESQIYKEHQKPGAKLLTGEDATTAIKKLTSLLNQRFSQNYSVSSRLTPDEIGTIKYDEILQVIDSLGNINFTFRVDHPETTDLKFFNLVMQEKSGGSIVKLMEYSMTEDFAALYAETFKLENFRGTIRSEVIINTSDCPDPVFSISIGGIGGPGGGGPSGPPDDYVPITWPEPEDIVIVFYPAEEEEEWIEVHQSPRNYRLSLGFDDGDEEEDCVKVIFGVLYPMDECTDHFLSIAGGGQVLNFLYLKDAIYASILNYISANSDDCNRVSSLVAGMMNQLMAFDEFETITPLIIENNIDDSELDPCSKQILGELKGLGQNDIALVLAKLDNPVSLYNCKIKSQLPNNPLNLAETNWQQDGQNNAVSYSYLIKIKPTYPIQATRLGIAATLMHELIHSYFLSLIDDCHQANNCALLETFPELWNYYVQHKFGGGPLTNASSQHAQIANSYVNILSRALQEYDTGIPVPDNIGAEQIYRDLAWGGLVETAAYDGLSDDDKTRIEARNNAENFNQPSYNPSGTLICTPHGTPCQ